MGTNELVEKLEPRGWTSCASLLPESSAAGSRRSVPCYFFLQIDILGFEFLLQGLDLPKRILQSASARWRFNSAAALAAKTLTRSIARGSRSIGLSSRIAIWPMTHPSRSSIGMPTLLPNRRGPCLVEISPGALKLVSELVAVPEGHRVCAFPIVTVGDFSLA